MAKLVRFRVLDGIAVVTLNAPPVNALSAKLRAALWEAFTRVQTNDDIKAAVLMATGPMFSAGGDIREFAIPRKPPTLSQVCNLIETCGKPVVAAVQGQALGGGAELVLAAHYRLAGPSARIGLPEVSLGLVPGAGGTQRLPRLIGVKRALQMILSARIVDAGAAKTSGLIDEIIDGDLMAGATGFAQKLIANGQGPRPTRDQRGHLSDGRANQAVIADARAAFDANPLHAPQRVLECVEAASLLPFDAALAFEADAFERCLDHPQSVALRHVFLAERRIDDALIARDKAAFRPVDPMGKAVVLRLRRAMRAAAKSLVADGATEAEIDAAAVAYGFRRGPFGGKETGAENNDIARKLVAALMVEGAACVDQQAVQRPSDIDALAVHGMGFPRRKGGPMRATQTLGLIAVRRDLREWAHTSDVWAVPEILDDAIKDARGFDAIGVLVLG